MQRVLLAPLDHGGIDAWRAAVNQTLIRALGGDMAMFQLDLPGVDPHYSEQIDTGPLRAYSELLPDLEQTRGMARRYTEIGAGNRAMLWSSHLEWLYGSDYFNTLVVETRAFDPLWVAAPVPGTRRPAVVHVYHQQRDSSRYFGARELQIMRVLRPALETGVRAITQAAANRESLATTFDSLGDGALIYDLQGRLVHRSRSVAALAGTRRGEEIIVSAGRELAQAMAAGNNAVRNVSTRGGVYRLTAILLGEGVFTMRPAVLVTLAPRDERLPDRDTLRHGFDLTPRQTDVALLMAKRRTNAEMADELCISEHTVRSHVEAVMGKLGLHDRRELPDKLRTGGGAAEGSKR